MPATHVLGPSKSSSIHGWNSKATKLLYSKKIVQPPRKCSGSTLKLTRGSSHGNHDKSLCLLLLATTPWKVLKVREDNYLWSWEAQQTATTISWISQGRRSKMEYQEAAIKKTEFQHLNSKKNKEPFSTERLHQISTSKIKQEN